MGIAEDLIRVVLNEKVEVIEIHGRSVPLYKNYTLFNFVQLLKSNNVLRGIVDSNTSDVYWWNANLAIHNYVSNELGISVLYKLSVDSCFDDLSHERQRDILYNSDDWHRITIKGGITGYMERRYGIFYPFRR